MSRIQMVVMSAVFLFAAQSLQPRSAAAEMIPPAVAVLYFDYTGQNEQLTVLKKGLAQMLISDLETFADNCVIVERDRLEGRVAALPGVLAEEVRRPSSGSHLENTLHFRKRL